MDYDEACKAAATAQGLDDVIEALTELGTEHRVEQTGGMCMVVTVPAEGGTWGVTADEGAYVCWYPGDSWRDGLGGYESDEELADWRTVAAVVSAPPAEGALRP